MYPRTFAVALAVLCTARSASAGEGGLVHADRAPFAGRRTAVLGFAGLTAYGKVGIELEHTFAGGVLVGQVGGGTLDGQHHWLGGGLSLQHAAHHRAFGVTGGASVGDVPEASLRGSRVLVHALWLNADAYAEWRTEDGYAFRLFSGSGVLATTGHCETRDDACGDARSRGGVLPHVGLAMGYAF